MRTPATVQLTDDTRNSTKPQPESGRFSASVSAPAMPKPVPSHLRASVSVRGLYESDESVIRRPLLKS